LCKQRLIIIYLYLVQNILVNSSSTLGGAVYIGAGSYLNLESVNITNITAKSGAAIYVSGLNASINSSVFANLNSTNGDGGAIFFGVNSGFSFNGVCVHRK
jgi:hypothetical protein